MIPYGRQSIGKRDIDAVSRQLKSAWLTQGPTVQEFEKKLAKRVGARDVVVFSSGTAALHAAYAVCDLKKNDEVLTTPLTFAATANAALYVGATPTFVDVDPRTGTMDPRRARKAVTRRTKVLAPVDFAGNPCNLRALRLLARQRNLVLIEDACHALGARYRGTPVGSIADMTVFSFHPVKHITTGEGGAVATDRPDWAKRMRIFRQHGITKDPADIRRSEGPWYYEMQTLGYNYRLTDIQCALGLVQLARLPRFLTRRNKIVAAYNRAFADIPSLHLPEHSPNAQPAWHLYVIRLKGEPLVRKRRQVFEYLHANGLGVQVHYIPVHLHSYYRKRFGYQRGDFPFAEAFYDAAISIPLFPAMTDTDVSTVIRVVRTTFLSVFADGEGRKRKRNAYAAKRV